jgi:hypothetical protein
MRLALAQTHHPAGAPISVTAIASSCPPPSSGRSYVRARHGSQGRRAFTATSAEFVPATTRSTRNSATTSRSRRRDAFDESYEIKTCDLGRWLHGRARDRRAFARELVKRWRHRVSRSSGPGAARLALDEANDKGLELYRTTSWRAHALPAPSRFGSVNQGYFPIKETSDIHPDLSRVGSSAGARSPWARRPATREQDFWPAAGLRAAVPAALPRQGGLIRPSCRALLTHLGCDPHLYDARLTARTFGLRLNYYPPLSAPTSHRERRAARARGRRPLHLPARARVEGLQVLNRRNMKWVRLRAPRARSSSTPATYMQRISNDVFPSTTHRVAKPRDPAHARAARLVPHGRLRLGRRDARGAARPDSGR